MLYCHKCDDPIEPCNWKDPYRVCPKHGYDRNPNGTLKSTLSPQEKIEIKRLRENYERATKKNTTPK